MTKELLIFGANGELGKGLTKKFLEKDYDKIYLFASTFELNDHPNVEKIIIKDLSIEENVVNAFSFIKGGKDKMLFLYSAVGGYFGGKTIWETEDSDWENIIKINLKTSFLIAKYFAKFVAESYGGAICFTAAETGIHAESKKAAYGVSKSALIHLVKTLALEGGKIKLSVNAIAPYIIDTPSNRKWMKDTDYSGWIKPEEIGELAFSLFNNFNFITGNILELKNRFEVRTK
jgi:NAD(P)-dependent dehydrogenase (short-subunit alcohol dehydrogenase family)